MSDRVIVVGSRRGNSRIQATELLQMAGRVSRNHSGTVGYVDFVVEESDLEDVKAEVGNPKSFRVESHMDNLEDLCFHLVSEIARGGVRNENDAFDWYKRSFAFATKEKPADFKCVIGELKSIDAVKEEGGVLSVTPIGLASSSFYFSPYDVFSWKTNFDEVFDRGIENVNECVAWAMGNVPSSKIGADISRFRNTVYRVSDVLDSYNLEIESGSIVSVVVWNSLIGGPSVTRMGHEVARIKKDYPRINQVMLLLDEYSGWERKGFFEDLKIRVSYRVPQELVSLCKIPEIGKSDAAELYNIGVTNAEEAKESLDFIESSVGERLFEKLSRVLNEAD